MKDSHTDEEIKDIFALKKLQLLECQDILSKQLILFQNIYLNRDLTSHQLIPQLMKY